MTPAAAPESNRLQRIIAFMIASAVGLSVIAFIAVIVASASGVADFGVGVWPIVVILPLFGLPIAFALIIALLVVSLRRRSREARNQR